MFELDSQIFKRKMNSLRKTSISLNKNYVIKCLWLFYVNIKYILFGNLCAKSECFKLKNNINLKIKVSKTVKK